MMRAAFFALLVTLVASETRPIQYPADLNPSECPNYPFCGPSPIEKPAQKTEFRAATIEKVAKPAQPQEIQYIAQAAPINANYYPQYYLLPAGQQYQQFAFAPQFRADPQFHLFQAAEFAPAPKAAAAAPAPVARPIPAAAPAAAPAIPEAKYRKVVLEPEYPAGVNPAECPNFPFCGSDLQYVRFKYEPITDGETQAADAANAPKYPANFDSTNCIDYPFCQQKVFRRR